MNKYRFCSGLAIFPEHDMKMLSRMSSLGWHLKSFSGLLYTFEKGKPINYIYSINLENAVDDNMLSLYRESGWEPVIAQNGYQIFRAPYGTSPIFSDTESEIQVLEENRKKFGKASFVSFLAVILCLILSFLDFIPFIVLMLFYVTAWACFVFAFFPFVGLCFKIRKLKKE